MSELGRTGRSIGGFPLGGPADASAPARSPKLINQRLSFRIADSNPTVRLRTAAELLDSDYPGHHAAGRQLYAAATQARRLADRDGRLLAGQHPGFSDPRYHSACRYAERGACRHRSGGRPR